jgi:EAL domain-containing protein (putative c-di-GMP-specific phosphodiesterase class I)
MNLDNEEGQAIANTIIQLALNLNLKVIAEGIETDKQFEFLKEQKCHILQGYKFGKPMPEDTFTQWLKDNY